MSDFSEKLRSAEDAYKMWRALQDAPRAQPRPQPAKTTSGARPALKRAKRRTTGRQ